MFRYSSLRAKMCFENYDIIIYFSLVNFPTKSCMFIGQTRLQPHRSLRGALVLNYVWTQTSPPPPAHPIPPMTLLLRPLRGKLWRETTCWRRREGKKGRKRRLRQEERMNETRTSIHKPPLKNKTYNELSQTLVVRNHSWCINKKKATTLILETICCD